MANKGEKYVIEHGVSVPGARTLTKYPWRQMKVGDSFVASYEEVDHIRSAAANDLKERLRQHISDFLGSLTKERGSLVPSVRVVLCEDGTMIAIVDPTQLVRYTPEV